MATFSIILGITSVLLGILSAPFIHERFIDPFQFKRKKGRIISGLYHAVWYTSTVESHKTWEEAEIKQRGKKIRYKCFNNDAGFDYELIGQIDDDIVTGHWISHLPGEKVHGGAVLHYTKRGSLVGMWVGDCKKNDFTWGYWAISKDKKTLETFVENMEKQAKFKNFNLLSLIDKK